MHRRMLWIGLATLLLAAGACSSSNGGGIDENGTGGTTDLSTGGTSSGLNGTGTPGIGSGGTLAGGGGTLGGATGGAPAIGTGGVGAGTGGMNAFQRPDAGPVATMCPAAQPADMSACNGPRGMNCTYGDMTCRCRRQSWRCSMSIMPPDNDGGAAAH